MSFRKDTIFRDGIDAYAAANSTPVDDKLARLAATTKELFPDWADIMTSPVQARFLRMLVSLSRARRVLEIGTFTGFSALNMASALPPDGVLITCDNYCVEARAEEVARRAFAESEHGAKISLVIADAGKALAQLEGPFDFIFLDADKPRYHEYYERILDRGLLTEDGALAIDNTLWGGLVLRPPHGESWVEEWAAHVQRFNAHVAQDPRVEAVLLTIFDGMTLVRKKRRGG